MEVLPTRYTCFAGGLTSEQKGQIIMAAGSAAYAGDMTFTAVGAIYGAKGMADMKHTGIAVGSALGDCRCILLILLYELAGYYCCQ